MSRVLVLNIFITRFFQIRVGLSSIFDLFDLFDLFYQKSTVKVDELQVLSTRQHSPRLTTIPTMSTFYLPQIAYLSKLSFPLQMAKKIFVILASILPGGVLVQKSNGDRIWKFRFGPDAMPSPFCSGKAWHACFSAL